MNKKQCVDEAIHAYYCQSGAVSERLIEAILYSVDAGGKRFRPLILLDLLEDLGIKLDSGHYDVAAALEMIHTASLIHDDLPAMDNDDYRRGRLTNHKQFDEATAILAGDSLFLDPFGLISGANLADRVKVNLIQSLSQASGSFGMVAGQMLDMAAEHSHPSIEELATIHRHKTGCLLAYPFFAAGILADVSQKELVLLKQIGELVGLSFQVRDDILDVTADFATLGKTPNKDIVAQKVTYPSLLGLDNSHHILEDTLNRAFALVEELEVRQSRKFIKLRALLERLRLDD
ncbi:polyprenyl synthetase family protein [Streptococcus sciuri]|uniref:Polyprenyl synthetase family protein n=1 Tax=Streptococcus sciuri TaxID=2973939 RepID=A0ABT2F8B6_9STRE|nr:farnesyl diphosphate synthase [Streptococcus sciuri]MCS4488082.1 polyprenyl synthetase family protein [Streptococcus sciuri]